MHDHIDVNQAFSQWPQMRLSQSDFRIGAVISDDLLMRLEKGKNTVLHNDLCKGCKVCEDTCPNGAMHVVRRVLALQKTDREEER